jgi:hypothetical protein
MKNRDLGYHGWFVWGPHALKFPVTVFTSYPKNWGFTAPVFIGILSKD